MTNLTDATALRRWAMQCAAEANDPRTSGDERARLLRMRQALLDLATIQDWLNGNERTPPMTTAA